MVSWKWQCLSQAKQVMNRDAIFLATFLERESDYEGLEWIYPGCVGYTFKCIQDLADKNDLVCEKLEYNHPNSQTWFAIRHRSFIEVRDSSTSSVNWQRIEDFRAGLSQSRSRLDEIRAALISF
ncbi:MAG: hypothetical protein HC835_16760 [Oscillatoriales cyanobacterium RM2_1_1]|nr:hypothetical protein [Oscillatoriales cyanobacterium SM2_3_0]NJO47131.1 hypothetical protein [Oscillatoriales cyanobacterium RM2_1_1]